MVVGRQEDVSPTRLRPALRRDTCGVVERSESRSDVYRLGPLTRLFLPAFYVFAAALTIGIFRADASDGGISVFIICWSGGLTVHAWFTLMRLPHQLVLDDQRIRLIARSRELSVPWPDLVSVKDHSLGRSSILWEWRSGRARTMGPWVRQRELRAAIERHAPQARVEGL